MLKSVNSDPRLNKRKPKKKKKDNDLKDEIENEANKEEEELKDEIENEANKEEEEEKQNQNDDSSVEKISPNKESKQISKKKDGKKKKDKKERKRRTNRRVGSKKRPKYRKKIGKNQGEEPTKTQREGYTISAIGFLKRMLQKPINLEKTYGVDLIWVMKKSLDIGFYPFISNTIDVKYLCLNSTSLW